MPATQARPPVRVSELGRLLAVREKLCPELLRFFVPAGASVPYAIVRHPLIYSVPYVEGLNAVLNHQLKARKQAISQARKDRDWQSYIMAHERPWRLTAFGRVHAEMDDAAYWGTLSDLWIASENIWEQGDEWRSFLTSRRTGREGMMTAADRRGLLAMESVLTVYRGATRRNLMGFSWSIDREQAAYFANRFGRLEDPDRRGYLLTGRVARGNVLAYLTTRGENEIVALPEAVSGITKARI